MSNLNASAYEIQGKPVYNFGYDKILFIDDNFTEGKELVELFSENKIKTLFIFGGTNDSWIDAPIGNVKYSDWTADELKQVLPAFCYLIDKAMKVVEDIVVIINTDLKKEIADGFIEVCEKNRIKYLCLKEIDKENGHPTELGMKQISEQVAECLKR